MPHCHLLPFNKSPYADLHCPMRTDQRLYDAITPESKDYTVRFYTWPHTTLSIGRFQRLNSELEQRLRDQGISWVRRPTGGQAILHQGDLTFSIVGPLHPEHQHHLLETYHSIAQGLTQGLQQVGIHAETVLNPDAAAPQSASCYASRSQADLQVHGKKLIGCAQVRRRRAFLQQGVIYRQAPHQLHQQLFGEAMPVIDLATLCAEAPPIEELAHVLGQSLQSHLAAS